jgi:arylsulfatase A-like enzyme
VQQLKAWGLWDRALVIVTSDHGEELLEAGRCGHAGSLRDAVVRVPLLVHDPSRFPGATVVDEGSDTSDVLPTVMAALAKPAPVTSPGEPLEALAQGVARGWPRPSFTVLPRAGYAIRVGRWKLTALASAPAVVADLAADPGETRDVGGDHPVERRMLTDQLGVLAALSERWNKREWGVASAVSPGGAAALDEAATP